MKNNHKNFSTLAPINIVLLIFLALIILLYIISPTRREDIHVELIKTIGQGIVIGILGAWIKQLFDNAAKERELEREKAESRIEQRRNKRDFLIKIIDLLISQCQESISISMAAGTTLAAIEHSCVEGMSYLELLRRWRLVEPKSPAIRAGEAFSGLMETLGNLEKEKKIKIMKETAKNHFESWLKYFDAFSICLATGQDTGSLEEPTDWKLKE
jgi:hypothetical protein